MTMSCHSSKGAGGEPGPAVEATSKRKGDHISDFAARDCKRIANPDFNRPFTSVEDAIERLLPYHVRLACPATRSPPAVRGRPPTVSNTLLASSPRLLRRF